MGVPGGKRGVGGGGSGNWDRYVRWEKIATEAQSDLGIGAACLWGSLLPRHCSLHVVNIVFLCPYRVISSLFFCISAF